MKISKKVFWLTALFAGSMCGTIVAEIPQQIGIEDQDTLGIAAAADEMAMDAMPEIEEIGQHPSISSALLKERFSKLEKTIPLRYHESSHEFVEYFIYKKARFTQTMMERMPLYFPIFEKALQQHNLPQELKYLSMIESGLNPQVLSRARAGGLWQFMPATGREFGLIQDGYIDERFDPIKSTEAACKYLKQLYRIFGDWEMALASYNTGPGNVKRAMRRSGGTTFWTIYNALPRETRSYVPQYVAMNYMMNFGNDHGIFPENLEFVVPSDTIHINGHVDLMAFCQQSGIDFEVLNKLNPQIVKTSLPEHTRNFVLRVPSMRFTYLKNNRAAIMDSCTGRYAAAKTLLASLDDDQVLSTRQYTDAQGNTIKAVTKLSTQRATHTVRSGESLALISRKYGVDISDLKRWNGIRGTVIRRGQRLVYHKEVKEVVKVKLPSTGKTEESVENQAKIALVSNKEEATETTPEATTRLVRKQSTHIVRSGETLGAISEKYNVGLSELKKWNNLHKSLIRKGQRLVIYTEVMEQVALAKPSSESVAREHAGKSNVKYHTVQRGDTLWTISQRYGLQIEILKKTNNIQGSSIKPGQKLVISG
ncbi:LysM peptidoglycan-binding domain-containing protein [Dyadobacter tibetensis]|uniref:LysM peptidoglycan-binding domain-containing protein n=1 Tax=Dyadobacter tibetensis TaxID=1211851 RepID=UPI00047246EF|nr:LysM peptidoglycan-binding domain-containing protein [Dyadobacter tibetensis]